MNRQHIEGMWKRFSGEVRQRYGRLFDAQLELLMGKRHRAKPVPQETKAPK